MEGSSASNNDLKNKGPTRRGRTPRKDHILRKRRPQKPERDDSVIYVNTKSPTKAFLNRCDKLIDKGIKEITLYCLGAAIQRGILVALQICEKHVAYQCDTATFTSELIDDLEPATDDADYAIQRRFNSANKMFFTIYELVRWLGLTVFEIWINLIAFLIFTVMLAVNYDADIDIDKNSWWAIFFPLFAGDALNAYFCVIIFIRMLSEMTLRTSLLRISWSGTFLLMTFLFKFLLCQKLLNKLALDYSEVFAPLYILLQLIAVRACQQS